jgi:chromosome segregation protein
MHSAPRDRLEVLRERAAGDAIDVESAAQSCAAPSPDASVEDMQRRIDDLKSRIARLGIINPLALEEYDEAAARYEFLSAQMSDLRAASTTLNELITELDNAIRTRFEMTFQVVAAEFERSFTNLFGGGEARLALINDDDDAADQNGGKPPGIATLGVEIIARPPGKRQQHLALLSGGERALTAAALLFAILKASPTPFCVLDEVDAALDETNVGRFREALVGLSEKTQFIVVTHNRGTIEAADTIYGVTMGDDGASRVLSLRLEEVGER